MAEETDKWIEFVKKLKELTESGSLRWHSVRPEAVMQREPHRKISMAFETKYKDRNLRLYEESVEHRYSVDMFGLRNPNWQEYTVLELVDENGAAWEFPTIEDLNDLIETVKFRVTGVNEYMEAVLAEKTS
jgi:hypothetical protein